MSANFPTYNRFPVTVLEAEGVVITDVNGKKYIDAGAGIGVCNLGHRNKRVEDAVFAQMKKYIHTSNLYKQPIQETVAKKLTNKTVGDYVFFANSGAEANEAAIKLARKATGKSHMITCKQSFHGRTFATMTATGQSSIHDGFGPLVSSFSYVAFNDFHQVKKHVTEDTAAIMLELIQGEGGVHIADYSFIKQVEAFCEANELLLIIDEIQTGMGRTGTMFAYEQYDLSPDIITLAKGLGNGHPIGAMIGNAKLKDAFGPGTHGSTFGGNPVSIAATEAVLEEITPTFLTEVQKKGVYLKVQLEQQIGSLKEVKEIRGVGLMLGIEIYGVASEVIQAAIKDGLLILSAGAHVIRLLPPLTVTYEEIDRIVSKLKDSILHAS